MSAHLSSIRVMVALCIAFLVGGLLWNIRSPSSSDVHDLTYTIEQQRKLMEGLKQDLKNMASTLSESTDKINKLQHELHERNTEQSSQLTKLIDAYQEGNSEIVTSLQESTKALKNLNLDSVRTPSTLPTSDDPETFIMRRDYFADIQDALVKAKVAERVRFRDNIDRLVLYDELFTRFWPRVGSGANWEPETFNMLKTFLQPTDTYLDFGAWIGPTVLYAAHFCKKIITLEPDILAYKHVRANIEFNPEVAAKTRIYPYCLSSTTGKFNMTGNPGSSMSRIGNDIGNYDKHKDTAITWTVDCYTMQDLLAKIKVDRIDMMKFDTEGAEVFILPALQDWILANKPTIWFSLHHVPEETLVLVRKIMAAYKHVYDELSRPVDVTNFRCGLCAVLITDRDIPPPLPPPELDTDEDHV